MFRLWGLGSMEFSGIWIKGSGLRDLGSEFRCLGIRFRALGPMAL